MVKQLLEKHGFVERKMKKAVTMTDCKDRNKQKVSENFKENMKIVFDDYLGKWNYRAIPEGKT
ncbi:hypothetical protein [Methanosarcina barkeri]|uniref:hypothetical protein n=1 Tax=Methanosarcina barkeri TaxID=2208 RepID=UPI00003C6A85|nr:hypothetical protein [Methanosarcina barkeri]